MKRKQFIPVFLWLVGGIFILFAAVSATNIANSYVIYTASRDHVRDADLERAHLQNLLLLAKRDHLQQGHSINHFDDSFKNLQKIEIRGDGVSPKKKESFSNNGLVFNVFPQ